MNEAPHNPYQAKLGYDSSHTRALAAVPASARVLDVGCAGGDMAAALKSKGCRVDGIDREPGAAKPALEKFFEADLDAGPLPAKPGDYDRVLLLDVVEHLRAPEAFVDRMGKALEGNRRTEVIATTGNVAFVAVRLMLLFGAFNYADRGILDHTHTRLFTFASFRRLFTDAGFEVVETKGIPAPFPLVVGDNAFSRLLIAINQALMVLSRGLFAYQIYLRLRAK
jgi:2-polyprenyl-3-methyl-5-hydroxy-6-metoxy-1,4-benzoquinol methylase